MRINHFWLYIGIAVSCIIVIALIFFLMNLFSDTGTGGGSYIEGVIIDSKSGVSISQASVTVKNRGWGLVNGSPVWDKDYSYKATADGNGKFHVDYKVGPSAHVIVTKTGYQTADEWYENNTVQTIKLIPEL